MKPSHSNTPANGVKPSPNCQHTDTVPVCWCNQHQGLAGPLNNDGPQTLYLGGTVRTPRGSEGRAIVAECMRQAKEARVVGAEPIPGASVEILTTISVENGDWITVWRRGYQRATPHDVDDPPDLRLVPDDDRSPHKSYQLHGPPSSSGDNWIHDVTDDEFLGTIFGDESTGRA